MSTDSHAGIRCAICDRPAPITVADITGPEPGDEYTGTRVADMLKPTAPPSGIDTPLVIAGPGDWMSVPDAIDNEPDPNLRDASYDETNRPEFDPERIMCCAHASDIERAAWDRQLSDVRADPTPDEIEERFDDLDDRDDDETAPPPVS